ncbi:MAG: adenylosuccinate synthetase, partial [Candidatus Omnitrophota bacterium]
DELDTIKICTEYKYAGKTYLNFPSNIRVLENCRAVYEEHPGWREETAAATTFAELPLNARRYIHRLEELLKVKVRMISVGSKREQIIRNTQ